MTFTATFGNGSRTAGTITTKAPLGTAVLGRQEIARAVFSAVVLGMTDPGTSVRRAAAGTGPANGTANLASVLPGRSRVSGGLSFTHF